MVKGFCRKCGQWENVHADGLCHTDHYGHEEGRAFPVAATPEAVARERGGTDRQLVDVEFPAQTGDFADTRRREADEALARAQNEPILGKLTAEGEQAERGAIDRTGPENVEEAKEAAVANVEGLKRDVDEMIDPPKVSEVDPAQAGDADLKTLSRSDQGDDDEEARPRRGAAKADDAAQQSRQRGAATNARDAGKASK